MAELENPRVGTVCGGGGKRDQWDSGDMRRLVARLALNEEMEDR